LVANGSVNSSVCSSIVSGLFSRFSTIPKELWSAPPAVAGRLVSVLLGLAKSREIAGRASTDEKLVPVAEPDVEENDDADEYPMEEG